MKKSLTIIMTFVMAGFLFASCGAIKNTASDTVAYSAGVGCSKALTALNTSRNTNGTISLSNSADLTNMLTVVTCYTQLRNNKDNADYRQSFTNGLIAGSNLITTANATGIVNTLLGSTGLNGVNAQNISSKIETVNSIIMLLNALKS